MKPIGVYLKAICTRLFILAIVLLHTGCEGDANIESMSFEKGTFSIALTPGVVQSEVITRAGLNLDVEDFQITLTEANGTLLFENRLLGELSEAECTLPAAVGYQLKAESCTPEEAITLNDRWGMAHFVGTTTFDIESNQHTSVSLTCTMDNAGVQFVFEQSFLDKFPIHAVTTQDSRSLVFNQENQDKIAYYPVIEEGTTIRLKLTGSAGGWSDRIEVIQEMPIQSGKIYTVNVAYNGNFVRCQAQ